MKLFESYVFESINNFLHTYNNQLGGGGCSCAITAVKL